MKNVLLYGGIMLVLASGMFYMYYNAGRFNNTYKELDERMEAMGKTKDSLQSVSENKDSLHQKQNSDAH